MVVFGIFLPFQGSPNGLRHRINFKFTTNEWGRDSYLHTGVVVRRKKLFYFF